MPRSDPLVEDEPPADIEVSGVLPVLLRAGRWADAASYQQAVDDTEPTVEAALLLAAGRVGEARAVLNGPRMACEPETPWLGFLRHAATVLDGRAHRLPDLVTEASDQPAHPVLLMLMVRAATAADQSQVAAHYGRQLLEFLPGEAEAAAAVAIDLIQRGNYPEAVRVLDRVELALCVDETAPLQLVLRRLAHHHAQANALVTIGRYIHREKDPTVPLTAAAREARRRWRSAYRTVSPPRWGRRLAWLATPALGLASLLTLHTGLPGLLLALALAAWLRTRTLPGLDLRTSQQVRALRDPRQVLLSRRYRPIDVLTFILVGIAFGVLASELPRGPSWLGAVEAIVVVLLAAAATRGRRRWARHEKQRVLPEPFPPSVCRCLDHRSLHGSDTRDYVERHLFLIGSVPGRADWRVLQCLTTHCRFLDLPGAQLTLRLPSPSSGQFVSES